MLRSSCPGTDTSCISTNSSSTAVGIWAPWCKFWHNPHIDCDQEKLPYTKDRYWDWTLDVADVAKSDIWDTEHGFGGNGGSKTEKTADAHHREWKCLTDGPFKDIRPAYILTEYAPHCLSRDFFDGISRPGTMRSSAYTPEAIASIIALDTFVDFEFDLENKPHASIHSAVGGKMGDMGPSSSPNEPLFFLHHAQVDRLWWLWQQGDPSVRNTDYAGKREITPGVGGRPLLPGEVAPVDPPAALTDVMPFMKLADDVPVSAIMTTENDLLCYTY
jgi:tyrosinase